MRQGPLAPRLRAHDRPKTKLLDIAIEAAKDLPAEMQDEVAGILLSFMGAD